MAEEPETPIQEKYAKWLADQLEKIRSKQATLKEEEKWLQERLDAATEALPSPGSAESGEGSAPAQQEQEQSVPAEAAAPVPQQRKDIQAPAAVKPAAKGANAKAAVKTKADAKAPAKKKPVPAKKTPSKSAAKKTAVPGAVAKETGPALHQLLRAMLLQKPREPRTTKEMHAQLAQDHPERDTSMQTVRNNLERLVALSQATRSNQQGSVMYTASVDDIAPAPDAAAVGESEQASEPAAEKVPAEV